MKPTLIIALALSGVARAQAPAPVIGDGYTDAQRARSNPIVQLVRNNRDAVVNVAATHVVEVRDHFFDFFDTPNSRQMKTNSVGSGALIHGAGYVLTNAHVVAQASELRVITAEGLELPAELVASMPEEDLAVLRVRLRSATNPLKLGRSSDLMVGETVVAIGNPVGLQSTVTTGIVSALGREFEPRPNVKMKGIIQTDAAINPGNSGGPLLNVLGELIGINTAIRTDAQNVGFAIPVDRVRQLLPELLAVETRGRVRLGIGWGQEVDVPGRRGVTIARITPGSPAQKANLVAGLVVTKVAGYDTPTLMDALAATLEQPSGRPFAITVAEGAERREVRLMIEELPKPDGAVLALARFGLALKELDAAKARGLGLRGGSGLVAGDLVKGSPAARAGIEPGDLVTQIAGYGLRDLPSLGLLLEKVAQGDRVPFTIVRLRGRTMFRSEVALVAR